MNIWSIITSRVGNAAEERVILWGKFALEGDASHPQGPRVVVSSYMVDGTYYMGDDEVDGALFHDVATVYWLPWRNGQITSATLSDLNRSGCQYFLTSTFSGCRFVVTEDKVAHVAWLQSGFGSTSGARDLSEWNRLHGARPPLMRRKLSITGVGGSNMGAVRNQSSTYGVGEGSDGADPGRAVVMGYIAGVRWKFKALIYSNELAYWHPFV
ncbi:hypothetical protein ACSHWC_10920 [Pseudomonas fluorescens]